MTLRDRSVRSEQSISDYVFVWADGMEVCIVRVSKWATMSDW